METRRRVVMQMLMGLAMGRLAWGEQISNPLQLPTPPGIPRPSDPMSRDRAAEPDPGGKMSAQQEKIRNTERQKRLEADTDKLLALATELKQDVEKTDRNVLSVDVIKKADEIERLAKSVKERMKG